MSETLIIDGREVPFVPGQTVLQAADAAGFDIPRLCHYPGLEPIGACRLCVVEIDGVRGYPTACTQAAAAGQVVRTESPELLKMRQSTMGLLLTKHPTGCLLCRHNSDCLEHHGCAARRSGTVTGCRFCPNDGQCEFQDLVHRLELDGLSYPVEHRGLPVDRRNPFIDQDPNLCVLCARCTRACAEVRGAHAIALQARGEDTLVVTVGDALKIDTACQFCGVCVDVCPTGSLSERVNKWVGPATGTVATTCGFCALGCQVELDLAGNQVVRSRPAPGEALCVKGRFAPVESLLPENRLLTPMMRIGGRLLEADWDEALAAASAGLAQAAAPAVLASRWLLDHELAAAADLAAALGTDHLASDVDLWEPGAELANATLDDLRTARRIVAIRADLRYAHTPVFLAVLEAVGQGAELLCVEPFPTDLAEHATEVRRPRPGEEATALDGWLEAPGTVVVWSAALAQSSAWAACREQFVASGAKLLPLVDGLNTRGVARFGGSAAEWFAPGSPVDALVTIGRAPWAERPPVGFWVALTTAAADLDVPGAERDADVVLPLTHWAETDGTATDQWGQLRQFAAASPPPEDIRPTAEMLAALRDGVAAAERGAGYAVERPAAAPAEPVESDLLLSRELSTFGYLGDSLVRSVPGLEPLAAEGVAWLHVDDAERFGVGDGDSLHLAWTGSETTAVAVLTHGVPAGVVRLVQTAQDGPIMGSNPCPVRIERVAAEADVAAALAGA